MTKLKKLEEIEFLKCIKIMDMEKIKIKNTDITLYYYPLTDDLRSGFHFYCWKVCQWIYHQKDGKPNGRICLFYGIAYFDGIKHLYFGDKPGNFEYLYYVDVDEMTEALKELLNLEKKYCNLKKENN